MRTSVALLLAATIVSTTACEGVDRAAATGEACTAAMEAKDSLAKDEEEIPDLDEFLRKASEAQNPALQELATRARSASERDDHAELEVVLEETRSVCESEGAV
jgi:hypothetical protein